MGEGLFSRLYQVFYEGTMGISATDWIRQDFLREPVVYIVAVFLTGLWLGAVTRWKTLLGLTLAVLVAVLIGHILGQSIR